MESVWPTLSAFPAARDATGSKKQLDAVLKDHAQAVKQILGSHRQVIAANVGQILTVRTFSATPHCFSMLMPTRNLILRKTPSRFSLSSMRRWTLATPQRALTEPRSSTKRFDFYSTSTHFRLDTPVYRSGSFWRL